MRSGPVVSERFDGGVKSAEMEARKLADSSVVEAGDFGDGEAAVEISEKGDLSLLLVRIDAFRARSDLALHRPCRFRHRVVFAASGETSLLL